MKYISSELEEMEREETFRLKRFKELKIKRARPAPSQVVKVQEVVVPEKVAKPEEVKPKPEEIKEKPAEAVIEKLAEEVVEKPVEEVIEKLEEVIEKPKEIIPEAVVVAEKIGEPVQEPEPRKKVSLEEMDENLYERVIDDTFPRLIRDEKIIGSIVNTNICACCLSLFETKNDSSQVICPLCQLEAQARERHQNIKLNVVPCESICGKTNDNEKRLDNLMTHINEVINLAEQYKTEGITSPSIENFIKSCSAVKCKIEDIKSSTASAAPTVERSPVCDESKPKSKPCSGASTQPASAAPTRAPSICKRVTDHLSELYDLTPVPEPKLGYFETKFKEIVKVTRLKNSDGTFSEEKQVITIKTERRKPHSEDEDQPCLATCPASDSGGGGGGYGVGRGSCHGGGLGGTESGGGTGGILASGSKATSGGGASVCIRESVSQRSGGQRVCVASASGSIPSEEFSFEGDASYPCGHSREPSTCGTASMPIPSDERITFRGHTPKPCDSCNLYGTDSMPLPCEDPTICKAGRPIPCCNSVMRGAGSVPMPSSDASVIGKAKAIPCHFPCLDVKEPKPVTPKPSEAPTLCSSHMASYVASQNKFGTGSKRGSKTAMSFNECEHHRGSVVGAGAGVCQAGSAPSVARGRTCQTTAVKKQSSGGVCRSCQSAALKAQLSAVKPQSSGGVCRACQSAAFKAHPSAARTQSLGGVCWPCQPPAVRSHPSGGICRPCQFSAVGPQISDGVYKSSQTSFIKPQSSGGVCKSCQSSDLKPQSSAVRTQPSGIVCRSCQSSFVKPQSSEGVCRSCQSSAIKTKPFGGVCKSSQSSDIRPPPPTLVCRSCQSSFVKTEPSGEVSKPPQSSDVGPQTSVVRTQSSGGVCKPCLSSTVRPQSSVVRTQSSGVVCRSCQSSDVRPPSTDGVSKPCPSSTVRPQSSVVKTLSSCGICKSRQSSKTQFAEGGYKTCESSPARSQSSGGVSESGQSTTGRPPSPGIIVCRSRNALAPRPKSSGSIRSGQSSAPRPQSAGGVCSKSHAGSMELGVMCSLCNRRARSEESGTPPVKTRSEASHRSPPMGEPKLRTCMSAGYQKSATSQELIGIDGSCECYRNTKQHPPSFKLELPIPTACRSTSMNTEVCGPEYSISTYSISYPHESKAYIKISSSKSVQTCGANEKGKNSSDKATSCIPNCSGLSRGSKQSDTKWVITELCNKEACTSDTYLECIPRRILVRTSRTSTPLTSCGSSCIKHKRSTSSCTFKNGSGKTDENDEVVLKGSVLSELRKMILNASVSAHSTDQSENEDPRSVCPKCASKFSKNKNNINHAYYTFQSKNFMEYDEVFAKEFCGSCGTLGQYSSTSGSASYRSAAVGSMFTDASSAVSCCPRNALSGKSSGSAYSDCKSTYLSLAQALKSSKTSCPAPSVTASYPAENIKPEEICCPKPKPIYRVLESQPSIDRIESSTVGINRTKTQRDAATCTKRCDRYDCRPVKSLNKGHACAKIRKRTCACHSDTHMLRYRPQSSAPVPRSQSCCNCICRR